MRILHTVQFYAPSVGGAQEVVKQISERLSKRGHTVTVATTKLAARNTRNLNGVRIEEFTISGNAVGGFTGETDRYRSFLLDGDFDVMLNYAAQQWATDLVFSVLERLPYRKVLAPCGFSGLYAQSDSEYFAKMPHVMHQYDHLVFHSDTYRDIEFTRAHGLTDYSVIPNGASEEEFDVIDTTFRSRHGIPEGRPLILTVGSHTGGKGHKLVIEAFRKADIGEATLVTIGNRVPRVDGGCFWRCRREALRANLFTFGRKRVLLLDPPRLDVVAAYQAADLFVLASHLECSPLVLFEAMASRTPFVTVACGNAEEIVHWGSGGVLVPTQPEAGGRVTADSADLARAIEDLVRDPEKRSRLGMSGYKAWSDRFTWEAIAIQYEQLYRELCERPRADTLHRHAV